MVIGTQASGPAARRPRARHARRPKRPKTRGGGKPSEWRGARVVACGTVRRVATSRVCRDSAKWCLGYLYHFDKGGRIIKAYSGEMRHIKVFKPIEQKSTARRVATVLSDKGRTFTLSPTYAFWFGRQCRTHASTSSHLWAAPRLQ